MDGKCLAMRYATLQSMTTLHARQQIAANELSRNQNRSPLIVVSFPLKMVCRRSLSIVTVVVLLALVDLPAVASAAQIEAICDRAIYGFPEYGACHDLLYGNTAFRRGGIFNIDTFDHGFLLPYFGHRLQFTAWQWRHRVTLPEVWRNRNLSFSSPINSIKCTEHFCGKRNG